MVSCRFASLVVPLLSAALLGCQVDSYLTCGARCDPDAAARRGSVGDSARPEGGDDVSEEGAADARPSAPDATTIPDAQPDGAPDAGTAGDGGGEDDGAWAGDGSPRVGEGGPCSSSTMCADDGFCSDAGICLHCLKVVGSACTSNRQCCSESCGASGCNAGGS